MEKLTREEAVKRHRELWNWLADNPLIEGRLSQKADHPKWGKEWPLASEVENYCWCCVYDTQSGSRDCRFCPVSWLNETSCMYLYPVWEWEESYTIRAAWARQIANLPERLDV